MNKSKDVVREAIEKIKKNISSENKSAYYCFGFEYFGPFLFGFTKWLGNGIRKEEVDKVFFFSRDGYMMEKAFDFWGENKDLKKEYVYFSRKSIRQTLLWKCDSYESSLKFLSLEKYISYGKLLEYYGFSVEERKRISEDRKIDLSEDLELAKLDANQEVKNLYLSLEESIKAKSKEQDALLLDYLKRIGFSGKCAIVDIGWHGSMQYYLEEFVRQHGLEIMLAGYYVGVHSERLPLRGKTFGYLYSDQDLKLRKSVLCFFGVYEKLFQSLEGSTYGYEWRENRAVPVLNEYEYTGQEEVIYCINEWQDGALDFIKIAAASDFNEEDLKQWAMPLVNFGKNPSLEGVKLLSFLYNTDGIKEYYVSQKPLYKYRPKEFIHALSNSLWKTGFMKSVFRLPLPYYWVYRLLRR